MPAIPIDPDIRDFLHGGVSILVAGSSPDNMPSLSRGYGCRVDGDVVTVLVRDAESGRLLDDMVTTGVIAVVFSRPTDYRTFQLKGRDACRIAVDDALLALSAGYVSAFCRELDTIGVQPRFCQALRDAHAAGGLVGLRFAPTQIFQQTPGPGAGEPLSGS